MSHEASIRNIIFTELLGATVDAVIEWQAAPNGSYFAFISGVRYEFSRRYDYDNPSLGEKEQYVLVVSDVHGSSTVEIIWNGEWDHSNDARNLFMYLNGTVGGYKLSRNVNQTHPTLLNAFGSLHAKRTYPHWCGQRSDSDPDTEQLLELS